MSKDHHSKRERPSIVKLWMGRLLASSLRNLIFGGVFVLMVCLLATVGYVIAGWSEADAFYMVVLTIFTVGYGEVRPINTAFLRADTMMLMILGCTGMIFLTGALIQFITITQFQQLFGTRRMKHEIDALTDHVIICGYGRIGVMLASELTTGQAPFVILERSDRRFAEARDQGYLCIQADATDETALLHAGITRARCLATVLPDDAANVFITLSARSLNATMEIIARGEVASTERKLIQAGANRVVMPTHIGAERIAQMILFAETERFLQGSDRMRAFQRQLLDIGLNVLAHPVAMDSVCVGLSVAEVEKRGEGSFFVVAIDRPDNQGLNRPPPETLIEGGDGVVLVSRDGRADTVKKLFGAREAVA
jgi:voltage-gated potassium channel